MSVNSLETTTQKEALSWTKVRSTLGLIFGSRAMDFDAFLDAAPTHKELGLLAWLLDKPEIRHTVFDLDGTLEPPYARISDKTRRLFRRLSKKRYKCSHLYE